MKKRKLLWYAGLSMFVFSMSGCGEEKTYGIQPPVKGLSWGMSLEEVEDVLGKDYTLETGESEDESSSSESFRYEETQKVYGQDAQVFVIMEKNPEQRYYQELPEKYLRQVSLLYEPEEGKKVLKELDEKYGPSEENFWGIEGSKIYRSAQTVADIEDEELKKEILKVKERLGQDLTPEYMDLGYIVTFEDSSEFTGKEGCSVWVLGDNAIDAEEAKRAIDK